MTASLLQRLSVLTLAVVITVPAAFAKSDGSEITQFGHDIRIGEDQKASDVTCFNCSVYVEGQVAGEITTIHGNIVLEENAMVGGEVTSLLGDVRMSDGAKIAGEVTVLGGKIRRPPSASIAGNVTVMEGAVWVYIMVLSPFLFLAAVIALIVWLVRRRRPAPVLARAA
jgi:acetyltransferase-like isoleucine patch superfamily enzyme